MDCKDVNQAFSMLRDFTISKEESAAVKEHLKFCPACRYLEKQMHKIDEVMKSDYLKLHTTTSLIKTELYDISFSKREQIKNEIIKALNAE
jgi:predicted anti-sigma-YlaC factor YlaD